MPNKKKQAKRILSVTIKHMLDDSPDTSFLGEYSDTRESEFTIDRAHDEDCPYNANLTETKQGHEILSSVWNHINAGDCADQTELNGESGVLPQETESLNTIDSLLDDFTCSCIGDDWNRREYRYFNGPIENYEGIEPEEIRKYVKQDYDRMESLNAGNWYFLGVGAQAEVTLADDVVQTIRGGSLWGIESDSDASFIEETEQDLLSELREQLTALGFSRRAIATAFETVEHKDA